MSRTPRGASDALEPTHDVDRLAHAVIGAAIEVHRHLGAGYSEGVYQAAMVIELGQRGIPFEHQALRAIAYKGQRVGEKRFDLLVGEKLIVELKAVEALTVIHTQQVLSYLKVAGLRLGLLINFEVPVLREGLRRVVRTTSAKRRL